MATLADRLKRAVQQDAPTWGIAPVPPELRRLGGLDLFVLWGDLAVGLLVLVTGALLVPALGFGRALLAIAVGTVLGCIPLALVGLAGAREGVPGMVLFRPVLGRQGSYLPSVLNIVQLVGWTGFEFWAMSLVADQMSRRLFRASSYWLWLVVVVIVCTALALGGPVVVVRQWLEKFGAWVVAAVGLYVTLQLLPDAHVGSLLHQKGTGGLPFWLAVDLVIVMPVSWLPLVADYTRFGRTPMSAGKGTFWGYAVGNAWFYALGALLVLVSGTADVSPSGIGRAIAGVAGGGVVLLALLVGETDEAFADIYSAAVSSQNLERRIPQRGAIVAISAAGAALAVWLGLRQNVALGNYESFLFLMGSVFVPLFGVFVADHFLVRRSFGAAAAMASDDERLGRPFEPRALIAWLIGFLVYQWCVPTGPLGWQHAMQRLFHSWLHLPFPLWSSRFGASIPSFGVALLLHWALWATRQRSDAVSR